MSLDTAEDVLTSTTLRRVPKKPMVRRTFYVPKALWDAARAKADDEETDISTILRELLERYVGRKR